MIDTRTGVSMTDDEVLDVAGLASYLNLSEHSARRLLSSGVIPANKVRREWRVLRSEVDKYLRGEVGKDET